MTNNHQEKNARSLSDHGAAEACCWRIELNSARLIEHIDRYPNEPEKLKKMRTAARNWEYPIQLNGY